MIRTKQKRHHLKAYSLSEILIVLCIIGILIYLVLPSQAPVVGMAKSIEAQNMLTMVHSLEKNHFYRHSKYSADLKEINFEQVATIAEGGLAVYKIEIIEASLSGFKATATSLQDLDGDGVYSTWQIDENRELKEIIKD
ncbi:type IV pilin protein [Pontimicrobium sp. MEBiC06410]